MRVNKTVVVVCLGIPLLIMWLITYLIICSDDTYWTDIDSIPLLIRSTEGAIYDYAVTSSKEALRLPLHEQVILSSSSPVVTATDEAHTTEKKALFLPQALQPVTYNYCCKMGSGNVQPTGIKCKDICFTQEACTNELYPFTSKQEKQFFYQSRKKWKLPKWRRPSIDECVRIMSETPPQPARWCQQQQHNKLQQDMNVTNIPMGCSMVMGMGGMSGPFDRTILFPEGKLAFCGIPKVGISAWLQFHRFTLGAKDYQSVPHNKDDLRNFRFDRLSDMNRRHILESDEWTKAVFLRNPAERFLSAYLDKVENSELSWLRAMPNMTFAEFVNFVDDHNVTCQEDRSQGPLTQVGMTWCMDPHWRPQTWSCGLWELLPHFDFVGSLDSADRATKALLKQVNLWDSYGKYYITSKYSAIGNKICKTPPPLPVITTEHQGFQQYDVPITNATGTTRLYGHRHKKNSSGKMKEYYTEELLKKVERLYADDYKLWNALSKSKVGWLSGKKIAAMLNPTCVVD